MQIILLFLLITICNVGHADSFDSYVNLLNTPRQITQFMQKNFEYKSDRYLWDEFKKPRRTFEDGYGDCEDFALFVRHVLVKHKYRAEVMIVYKGREGHAICLFRDDKGNLSYFSNLVVFYNRGNNFREIASDVFKDWTEFEIYPNKYKEVR